MSHLVQYDTNETFYTHHMQYAITIPMSLFPLLFPFPLVAQKLFPIPYLFLLSSRQWWLKGMLLIQVSEYVHDVLLTETILAPLHSGGEESQEPGGTSHPFPSLPSPSSRPLKCS